jgi:hypothetical protein
MKFEAKKELFYILICMHGGLMCGLLTGFLPWYQGKMEPTLVYLQLFVTLPLLVLPLYFYKSNYYFLDKELLYCKLGFITKKIMLSDIQIIYPHVELSAVKTNLNNPLNGTISPSLSNYGIVIKYGKYDYTFVSPLEQDKFIEKLLELKPAIEQAEWQMDC